jgi:hypothetical protein
VTRVEARRPVPADQRGRVVAKTAGLVDAGYNTFFDPVLYGGTTRWSP